MNIQTVAANLRNTIAGKEALLSSIRAASQMDLDIAAEMVNHTTEQFLNINIDELKRILADVEVCCQQYSNMGWQINPERMGQ